MLLVVDIGNTNIVIGLYNGKRLKDNFRIASRNNLTTDEIGFFVTSWLQRMHVENEQVDSVVIGSVVPVLTAVLETAARKYFGVFPVIVDHTLKLPIKIEIDSPEQIGADRICNAVAGYEQFGGELIVVDFGTATTFDIVSKDGAYIGGVILPGPETAMADLANKAAKLFEIKIVPPKTVIGKSTRAALQSGLFYGTIGQTDYLIEKIIEESKFEQPKVIATGGLAKGVEKHSKFIARVEPTLTLEGLRIIAELNSD